MVRIHPGSPSSDVKDGQLEELRPASANGISGGAVGDASPRRGWTPERSQQVHCPASPRVLHEQLSEPPPPRSSAPTSRSPALSAIFSPGEKITAGRPSSGGSSIITGPPACAGMAVKTARASASSFMLLFLWLIASSAVLGERESRCGNNGRPADDPGGDRKIGRAHV